MEIITVNPRGFCKGVVKAIQIAKETALKYPNEKITILGELVHNRNVVEALRGSGIHTLESKGKSRMELLDEIDRGVVIFSAHGINREVIQKAKDKGLITVDASCEDVLATQNLINSYLDNGYEILYVGQKHHPEAEAVITSNPEHIRLVTSLEDVERLTDLGEKIFVTNQTTMSILDIRILLVAIQDRFPDAIVSDEICNATRMRQEAILKLENIDCLIVVGDVRSNNTRMLAKIGQGKGIKNVLLIDNAKELSNHDLMGYSRIAITAGASTPTYLTNQVSAYCIALSEGRNPETAVSQIKPFL